MLNKVAKLTLSDSKLQNSATTNSTQIYTQNEEKKLVKRHIYDSNAPYKPKTTESAAKQKKRSTFFQNFLKHIRTFDCTLAWHEPDTCNRCTYIRYPLEICQMHKPMDFAISFKFPYWIIPCQDR